MGISYMLFLSFLSSIYAKKNDFILKPSNTKFQILVLRPNRTIRIAEEPFSYRAIVTVDEIDSNFRSLRVGKNYFCAPEDGNLIVSRQSFNVQKCSWKVESTKEASFRLKNGNAYLGLTDEMDHRRISYGLKLRLVPPDTSHKTDWQFRRAKTAMSSLDEDSAEEEDFVAFLDGTKKNKTKADKDSLLPSSDEKKKSSIIIGVSAPLKTRKK